MLAVERIRKNCPRQELPPHLRCLQLKEPSGSELLKQKMELRRGICEERNRGQNTKGFKERGIEWGFCCNVRITSLLEASRQVRMMTP